MTSDRAVRTPDDRFTDLPGYAYPPTYIDDLPGFEGLRGHYLDLGPRDAARTFLCLHGQPDWSYLYRDMISVFVETGARVVAPDMLGFGRSDKLIDVEAYGFHLHRDYLLGLVERLDLNKITMVVHDWGGILGLTLPVDSAFRRRLSRLVVMNTTLARGEVHSEAFARYRERMRNDPDPTVSDMVRQHEPHLSDAELAAYDAPFPDASYKAGVRAFPSILPASPEMDGVDESLDAARFWREEWSGQSFMAIGAKDPSTGLEVMGELRRQIRGCPEPLVIDDAGHFLPEHGYGHTVARAALESFGD